MDDPRPGIEEREKPYRPLLSRREVIVALVVGVLLAGVLTAVLPGARTHLFGGTERRETTVADVEVGSRSGSEDRVLTYYELRWSDGQGVHTGTFKRSGPPRRAVGETWQLWVSDDGSVIESGSPWTMRLFLWGGMPLMCLVLLLLNAWQSRVFGRMAGKDAARALKRRGRQP